MSFETTEPMELQQIDLAPYKIKLKEHDNGRFTASMTSGPYIEQFGILLADTKDVMRIRAKYRVYKILMKHKKLTVCGCGRFLDRDKPWMNICEECLKNPPVHPWGNGELELEIF